MSIKTICATLALSAMVSGGLKADSETLLYHKEGGSVRGGEIYEAEVSAEGSKPIVFGKDKELRRQKRRNARLHAEAAACENAKNRAENLGGTRFSLCICDKSLRMTDSEYRYLLIWPHWEWNWEEWSTTCSVKYARH